MIAPLHQPSPLEVIIPPRLTRAQCRATQRTGLFVMALGFFCFLPYPAIPVGSSTAIQTGNVLTLLAVVPLLFISWRRKPFWILPILLLPMCISIAKVAMVGGDGLELCFKSLFVAVLSGLTILAAQLYAPRYSLPLLTGIALATILHVAVGAWQIWAFTNETFPLYRVYVNPSFLSVQATSSVIAEYIQRPFGLFPEPSAMACSLAPWVMFWIAHLLGMIKLHKQPARWQNALFAIAAIGGLSLIILSQSGHALITLAGLAVIGALWLLHAKATFKTFVVLVTSIGIILPLILWVAVVSLSDRFGGKSSVGNSSWGDRSTSLVIGYDLVVHSDPLTGLFGMGPGLTAPAVLRTSGLEAVWSVLLSYIYDTGLVGMMAVGIVALYLLKLWKILRFDLVFIAILAVWLVGITITTSYEQLLPQWLALGFMTVWPSICEPRKTWIAAFHPPRLDGTLQSPTAREPALFHVEHFGAAPRGGRHAIR